MVMELELYEQELEEYIPTLEHSLICTNISTEIRVF
jgi:hypothetical protein